MTGPARAFAPPNPTNLTLPAAWAGGPVYAATPASDFFGERLLLAGLAASLKPWAIEALPCAKSSFADAAVEAAAAGAGVLVVTEGFPWQDEAGRAIVDARRAGATFFLHVVEVASGVPRFLAQTPLDRLEAIMLRLLAPGGCPWDREQTHSSLRPYVVEEAAEVIEAIERVSPGKLADELGDLLLQIAFHAALAAERGEFVLADVVQAIAGKMLYRHPHVFADWHVEGAQDVLRNWDILKAGEAAAAGEAGDQGAWRRLRKAAVRVGLAALDTAFAAAGGDLDRFASARSELLDETAALLAAAQDSAGGGAP